jgi:hypothetical protein|tara:strand:- start:155 stop:583 length:429 start_codon:yes stop_codon:yes gene_type:complete
MGGEYDWRPLEGERVTALMSRDAEEYARLCYELGIEPEDTELYAQGAQPKYDLSDLEKAVDEEEFKKLKPRKRSISDATYREFHDVAIGLSTNFWRDTDAKKNLLNEYFPFRGNTENMSPRQIGSKFANMLNYAKRRVRKNE